MRKIPSQFENFIDNQLIHLADRIQPYFYKVGFTPNMLTTISLLTWLSGLYFFLNCGTYYTLYTIALFTISYFFDCMDGNFARTYNMVSSFGDYYDHCSDMIKYSLTAYYIYILHFYNVLYIIMFFYILMNIHLSCQELYYGKPSNTLFALKYICPTNKKNVNDFLNITKYFGCGTTHLIGFLCIIYIKQKQICITNQI
jgi:phosphatidylserine synthase